MQDVPSCAHFLKAAVDTLFCASLESLVPARLSESVQEISMKRLAALLVLCVLILPLASHAQNSAPQAPTGRKKRVAVFDFDYATVKTSTAALFGTDIDVGKGISD